MAILELDGYRLSPKMPKGKITVRYGMNNFKYRLIYQYLISLLLTFKRLFHIPTPERNRKQSTPIFPNERIYCTVTDKST